jgi:hypothetical protein
LGESLIAKSDVTNLNTSEDFLTQTAEGARSPILGTQIGRRYVIAQSGGHSVRNHVNALERMA